MVVILTIAVRPQTIFLVVVVVAWDPLVGVHLLDMLHGRLPLVSGMIRLVYGLLAMFLRNVVH